MLHRSKSTLLIFLLCYALQWAEQKMISWMYGDGVTIMDRFVCNELRERLGMDAVGQQNTLRWYGRF